MATNTTRGEAWYILTTGKHRDVIERSKTSGVVDLDEYFRNLSIVAAHAHIYVETRDEKTPTSAKELALSRPVFLRHKMGTVVLAAFPSAEESGMAPEGPPIDFFGPQFQKMLPAIRDKYCDFPELIKALTELSKVFANGAEVKDYIRENFSLRDIEVISHSYQNIFQSNSTVHVLRHDAYGKDETDAEFCARTRARKRTAGPIRDDIENMGAHEFNIRFGLEATPALREKVTQQLLADYWTQHTNVPSANKIGALNIYNLISFSNLGRGLEGREPKPTIAPVGAGRG